MSIALLTILVLLVGTMAYALSKAFVRPVRVVGTCLLMLSLAALMIRSREIIGLLGIPPDISALPIFSGGRTPSGLNPTEEPGSASDDTFQGLSKQDHLFLNEIFREQDRGGERPAIPARAEVQGLEKPRPGDLGKARPDEPAMRAELVMNTAETKRSELITHRETVKRAQLVTHNETLKRAELVRSRQP
jgi:hypothetical protein